MAVTTDPSKTGISETDALALTGTTLAPNVVNASLNSITPTGGALTVDGSISATGQVGASAFVMTGYDASVYSTKLLLAGSSMTDSLATFIATNGAGRTYYMGPGVGDGQVTSFALYDNTSGATRWRSSATGFDVTGSISATDFIAGAEQTAPAAPAANGYRIFAQDNGAGKTQLMVIFASGAAQQIAIEP